MKTTFIGEFETGQKLEGSTLVAMTELAKEDLESFVEHTRKEAPEDNTHIAACDYAAKARIETDLEEVDHKFTCGTDGKKVKSITVKVHIPEDFVLQAHTHFVESWAGAAVEQLVGDLRGHLENIDPDDSMEDGEV